MNVFVFSSIMGSATSIGKKIQQVQSSACPQYLGCKHSKHKAIPITINSVTYRLGVGVQVGQALCLCYGFLKSSAVWGY